MLGGAAGVSVCGIVLEWRLSAHGVTLAADAAQAGRLAAFIDTFVMLAVLCLIALAAALQLRPQAGAARSPS